MKSTDRKILILVASLALLLAGCGGGGPSTAPPDPGQTADMVIMDAKDALTAAEAAVSSAMTEDAKLAAYREVQRAADNLVTALTTHGGSEADIAAAASKSGNAKAMADNLVRKIEDDTVAADTAMTALAVKLYDALGTDPLGQNYSRPTGLGGFDGTRVNDTGDLVVQVEQPARLGGNRLVQNPLKEDKTAMVAPLHGWTGSKHTATVAAGNNGDGTYTAHMYSDVGEPTQGEKFSVQYDSTVFDATTKVLNEATTEGTASRIASPRFDQSAGAKAFELPANNVAVMINGSYHGVSGTYSCVPGDGNTCAAFVAAKGFILGALSDADNNPTTVDTFTAGGGTWTFRPGDPNDLVTAMPDEVYPVYGWWQHEAPDGTTLVSAFTGYRGTDGLVNLSPSPNAFTGAIPFILHGTATYKGGAAGMYALQSSTGGTNDAGQFTADAELKATFSTTAGGTLTSDINHKIEGTIDNFMGSDGMSRDWSVALKEGSIGYAGNFPTESSSLRPKTTWSIGGTAAGEAGRWEGHLYKQNDGGVPTVGIGRFHSEYESAGRMVGAFGVNLEE